jgi:cytochrome c
MRLLAAAGVLFTCVVVVRAQNPEPRIWQGVYSTAQAERGKTSFNSSCLRCHGDKLQGNTAPALSGDRFFTTWGSEPIASLFAKIRDTMPPNFGTSIDDQTKLDIVAYILQTNGYPGGAWRADAERQRPRHRANSQEGRAGARPELFTRADGRLSRARTG